ncbi:YiiD C-terminal domain-containing protein [Marinobacteraceae bacterium S3BR75-40.1]
MPEQLERVGLQNLLESEIPLSRALAVQVREASADEIRLVAPLEPNHNHQGTAFGGSLYSVAVLAAWSLAQCWLRSEGLRANVVIQSGDLDYLEPVSANFEAVARGPDREASVRLKRTLLRHGRGRIELQSDILCEGRCCARFSGRFVLLQATSGA